jgi:hypothetical protein
MLQSAETQKTEQDPSHSIPTFLTAQFQFFWFQFSNFKHKESNNSCKDFLILLHTHSFGRSKIFSLQLSLSILCSIVLYNNRAEKNGSYCRRFYFTAPLWDDSSNAILRWLR